MAVCRQQWVARVRKSQPARGQGEGTGQSTGVASAPGGVRPSRDSLSPPVPPPSPPATSSRARPDSLALLASRTLCHGSAKSWAFTATHAVVVEPEPGGQLVGVVVVPVDARACPCAPRAKQQAQPQRRQLLVCSPVPASSRRRRPAAAAALVVVRRRRGVRRVPHPERRHVRWCSGRVSALPDQQQQRVQYADAPATATTAAAATASPSSAASRVGSSSSPDKGWVGPAAAAAAAGRCRAIRSAPCHAPPPPPSPPGARPVSLLCPAPAATSPSSLSAPAEDTLGSRSGTQRHLPPACPQWPSPPRRRRRCRRVPAYRRDRRRRVARPLCPALAARRCRCAVPSATATAAPPSAAPPARDRTAPALLASATTPAFVRASDPPRSVAPRLARIAPPATFSCPALRTALSAPAALGRVPRLAPSEVHRTQRAHHRPLGRGAPVLARNNLCGSGSATTRRHPSQAGPPPSAGGPPGVHVRARVEAPGRVRDGDCCGQAAESGRVVDADDVSCRGLAEEGRERGGEERADDAGQGRGEVAFG